MNKKVIDIKIWKVNKLRKWVDLLDKDRKNGKRINHLKLVEKGEKE